MSVLPFWYFFATSRECETLWCSLVMVLQCLHSTFSSSFFVSSLYRYRQTRFSSRRVRKRVIFKHGDVNVVQGNVAKRRRRYLQVRCFFLWNFYMLLLIAKGWESEVFTKFWKFFCFICLKVSSKKEIIYLKKSRKSFQPFHFSIF